MKNQWKTTRFLLLVILAVGALGIPAFAGPTEEINLLQFGYKEVKWDESSRIAFEDGQTAAYIGKKANRTCVGIVVRDTSNIDCVSIGDQNAGKNTLCPDEPVALVLSGSELNLTNGKCAPFAVTWDRGLKKVSLKRGS